MPADTIIPYGSMTFRRSIKHAVAFETESEARSIAAKVIASYRRQWPDDPDEIVHAVQSHGMWVVERWDGEDEYGEPRGAVRLLSRYAIESAE